MTPSAETSLLDTAVPDSGRPAPPRREGRNRFWWLAIALSVLLQAAVLALLALQESPRAYREPLVFEINVLSGEDLADEREAAHAQEKATDGQQSDKDQQRKPDQIQPEQPAQTATPPSEAPKGETPRSAAAVPNTAGAAPVPTEINPAPERGPREQPPERAEQRPVETPAEATTTKQAAPKQPNVDRAPKPIRTTGPAIPKNGPPNPRPPYPPEAKYRGHEGVVRARVQIGTDGSVRGVTIVESSGYVEIDQSVQKTLMEWRFVPATVDGRPAEGAVTLGFEFRLNG